jgi:hypothetical protein
MTVRPHGVRTSPLVTLDRCAPAVTCIGVMAGESGGCGIRTHGDTHAPQRFSRPPPSATRRTLRRQL